MSTLVRARDSQGSRNSGRRDPTTPTSGRVEAPMVKTILDNFCVKSGIFCSRCEEKLKKGQITDLDIRVIRRITELEKENPTLQNVTFHKAVEAGHIMALMADRRGMDTFLASGAQLDKNLRDRVGRRVKVLRQGGEDRHVLEGL